jgi:DNA-directed RNA polymerase subunit M
MEFDKKGRIVLPGTSKGKAKQKEKIKFTEKVEEKKDIGILKKKDSDVFPVIAETCQKCGHKEAYFWTSQTRAGDEAETRFFKCTKCEHTWREYK